MQHLVCRNNLGRFQGTRHQSMKSSNTSCPSTIRKSSNWISLGYLSQNSQIRRTNNLTNGQKRTQILIILLCRTPGNKILILMNYLLFLFTLVLSFCNSQLLWKKRICSIILNRKLQPNKLQLLCSLWIFQYQINKNFFPIIIYFNLSIFFTPFRNTHSN